MKAVRAVYQNKNKKQKTKKGLKPKSLKKT